VGLSRLGRLGRLGKRMFAQEFECACVAAFFLTEHVIVCITLLVSVRVAYLLAATTFLNHAIHLPRWNVYHKRVYAMVKFFGYATRIAVL
jgi:hypothetical protein